MIPLPMDDDEPPIELRSEPITFSRPTLLPSASKPLPSSIEAEKAVISSVLIDPKVLPNIDLTAKHFHNPALATIWEAIITLNSQHKRINIITIGVFLGDNGKLDSVGGHAFIAELSGILPTALEYESYVSIVLDKYRRREAITLLQKTIEEMHQQEESAASEAIASTIQGLRPLLDFGGSEIPHLKGFVAQAVDNIELLFRNKGAIIGVPTGFRHFDQIFGGWKGGQFIVAAARPSVGKSALAMNIALNAAKATIPTAVFTLEMSGCELGTRMLCGESRTGMDAIRSGELTKGDLMPMGNASASLESIPMYIDEESAISITSLRAKARKMKKSHDIGFIVIDYLQLMRSETRRAQNNRQVEISEISAGLKELAKDLNIPILALAQLNRDIEKRKDGRPQLSDLRESGSIEQDADIVLLMHRDKKEQVEDTFILIAKNRGGVSGDIVRLSFDGKTTTFREPEPLNLKDAPQYPY